MSIWRYVVSWVCVSPRSRVTDPFSAFFILLSTPSASVPLSAVCIHHSGTHTLFGRSVCTDCISSLPFLPVSSQASDLFQSVVASRVCVRLWPCPVKYRLFKEVSCIIWLLYCNYKVLLLEIAHRESCPQSSGSTGPSWCHVSLSLSRRFSPALILSSRTLLLPLTQMFPLITPWFYSLWSIRLVDMRIWFNGRLHMMQVFLQGISVVSGLFQAFKYHSQLITSFY